MDDFLDPYELENDLKIPGRTPHEIMEEKFIHIYKRNMWEYLKSIPWDGEWLKHETEEEKVERLAEIERNRHPFNKFF